MQTYFWDPEILYFWGLEGPRALGTLPKGGALRAPPFGMVSVAPGAVQTSKIDDLRVEGTCVFMIISIQSWLLNWQ
jgi:hypothetical protein